MRRRCRRGRGVLVSEPGAVDETDGVDDETVFATRRVRRVRAAERAEREIAMLSMPTAEKTEAETGDVYRPRAVPEGPAAPPAVAQAAASTRTLDTELVSVQRQTRRLSIAVLAGCVVGGAVSVVGLVALGIVMLA